MATESLLIRKSPMTTDVAVRSFGDSLPTDLIELVNAVRCQPLHVVAIPAEAIIHWRQDEPRSWKAVLEWLTTMDVEINVN